jgi:hypothetical protein
MRLDSVQADWKIFLLIPQDGTVIPLSFQSPFYGSESWPECVGTGMPEGCQ